MIVAPKLCASRLLADMVDCFCKSLSTLNAFRSTKPAQAVHVPSGDKPDATLVDTGTVVDMVDRRMVIYGRVVVGERCGGKRSLLFLSHFD